MRTRRKVSTAHVRRHLDDDAPELAAERDALRAPRGLEIGARRVAHFAFLRQAREEIERGLRKRDAIGWPLGNGQGEGMAEQHDPEVT